MPCKRTSLTSVPPASRTSATTSELVWARASGRALRARPARRARRIRACLLDRRAAAASEVASASAWLGRDAHPSQPMYTFTSRRPGEQRGRVKCSVDPTEIASARPDGEVERAPPVAAGHG